MNTWARFFYIVDDKMLTSGYVKVLILFDVDAFEGMSTKWFTILYINKLSNFSAKKVALMLCLLFTQRPKNEIRCHVPQGRKQKNEQCASWKINPFTRSSRLHGRKQLGEPQQEVTLPYNLLNNLRADYMEYFQRRGWTQPWVENFAM